MTGQRKEDVWYLPGLEDDMRARMFAARNRDRPFALATIMMADGGPRPAGSQMVIERHSHAGFLSGGCVEDDVALHGQAVIASGEPVHLVYGKGSPFVDMRLPCGGRLDILVERIMPDDQALGDLERFHAQRRVAWWASDGIQRMCVDEPSVFTTNSRPADFQQRYQVRYDPQSQLIIIGWDAYALAIADAAVTLGWGVVLNRPYGPSAPPPFNVDYARERPDTVILNATVDPWTAFAIVTHDSDIDHEAIKSALATDAAFVGVLGSRSRLPDRFKRLRNDGTPEQDLSRLKAPIGLNIGAANAREVAISVMAQIIQEFRKAHGHDRSEKSVITQKVSAMIADET